ncbi:MAG: hypothetical protein IKQ97_05760 [Eubacterium sp.]|nr:hypothetical protein [Eubacterium sp.]
MENNKKGSRDTVIKILQLVLCVAYVVFMSIQAISIYVAGAEARAIDPRAQIFTPEIVADALLKGLPLLIAAIAVTIIAAILGVRNKEKPFAEAGRVVSDPGVMESREKNRSKAVPIVRCTVLVIAVAFIILGIFNGGADSMLTKAITICTECIGLG